MKTYLTLTMVLLLSASALFAKNLNTEVNYYNKTNVEASLLQGVESNNEGLLVSAVQKLGDFKSDKAVIPLMKVLRSSQNESARISAALSLIKIGDSRGVYAVKQASKFDESSRVRELCAKFYANYQSII